MNTYRALRLKVREFTTEQKVLDEVLVNATDSTSQNRYFRQPGLSTKKQQNELRRRLTLS